MQQTDRRTLRKRGLLSLAGLAGLPSLRAAVEQAASEHRRPKLRITDIRTAEVRVDGYQARVRVYTDQGIVGQGEWTDATTGNVPMIRPFHSLDLWRHCVKQGEIIQRGFITPPDRLGPGVEMNDDAARKAQVPGTPWFEPTTTTMPGRG